VFEIKCIENGKVKDIEGYQDEIFKIPIILNGKAKDIEGYQDEIIIL